MIIYNLELSDVTVLHHDGEEPDHDLGAGSQENLETSLDKYDIKVFAKRKKDQNFLFIAFM